MFVTDGHSAVNIPLPPSSHWHTRSLPHTR